MRPSLLLVGPVAALLPLLASPPAQALSCVGRDDVISEAAQVFTGHILDASSGRLLISVDEVWKGGPVEERVWMAVDLPGWSEWSAGDGEVPDGYSSPDRWVFAPHDGAVGPCTAWRFDRALARTHAPDRAEPPVPDASLEHAGEADLPADQARLLTAAGVGVGSGAAAAAVALGLLRRRSPRRRSRRHPG